jgi:excisionase family DNA binding protein
MEPNTTLYATFPTTASAGDQSPGRLVLTVTEAAELLGISRAFAYELVARGELPSIHLGRRVVVPRVQLLALVSGASGSGLAPDATSSGSHRTR